MKVFHPVEIVATFAQPHKDGGVYAVFDPERDGHRVGGAGEVFFAAHIDILALVPPADDASHLITASVLIKMPHLLSLVVGQR